MFLTCFPLHDAVTVYLFGTRFILILAIPFASVLMVYVLPAIVNLTKAPTTTCPSAVTTLTE